MTYRKKILEKRILLPWKPDIMEQARHETLGRDAITEPPCKPDNAGANTGFAPAEIKGFDPPFTSFPCKKFFI